MHRSIIIKCVLVLVLIISLTGCACSNQNNTAQNNIVQNNSTMSTQQTTASYTQIAQEEAKEMMTKDDGHIIVDVRRQDEYDSGHIPNAILIPNESITNTRPEQLSDLNQIILIYCRSGNRSKQAAQKLADMGYTNVYEFGGINTWDGEIVK